MPAPIPSCNVRLGAPAFTSFASVVLPSCEAAQSARSALGKSKDSRHSAKSRQAPSFQNVPALDLQINSPAGQAEQMSRQHGCCDSPLLGVSGELQVAGTGRCAGPCRCLKGLQGGRCGRARLRAQTAGQAHLERMLAASSATDPRCCGSGGKPSAARTFRALPGPDDAVLQPGCCLSLQELPIAMQGKAFRVGGSLERTVPPLAPPLAFLERFPGRVQA